MEIDVGDVNPMCGGQGVEPNDLFFVLCAYVASGDFSILLPAEYIRRLIVYVENSILESHVHLELSQYYYMHHFQQVLFLIIQ